MPRRVPAVSTWLTLDWNGYVVLQRRIDPGRSVTLGSGGDVETPPEALGAESWELVAVRPGLTLARVPPSAHAVELSRAAIACERGVLEVVLCDAGAACTIAFGAFTATLSTGASPTVVRRRASWSTVSWFTAACALPGALLAVASSVPQPTPAELEVERIHLIRGYLARSSDRAEEPGGPESASREGGRGTRARGETSRYAVSGPADPAVARNQALLAASEFGMIGLLGSGAAGHASSALGNAWGSGVASARGAGGKGITPPDGPASYRDHGVSPPVDPATDRFSTFAVDVDTGSYHLAKRNLYQHVMPLPASVRVEEMINAFEYGYAEPSTADGEPFAVHVDAAPSPFDEGHHVVRVAIQGRRVPRHERPPVHLTYLVDTSGSMQTDDKIGLVKESLRLLTRSLRPTDTVALCTYAGSVRLVLPPTPAQAASRIDPAIDQLTAEGSTAMASGLALAYSLAARSHVAGEISRVVVLSDGDANVGSTSPEAMLATIERHRRLGIRLSTVGFGQGNYKDAVMEPLADAGDGNYSYVGSLRDAKRVFVEQVEGLVHVIARDVKVQVEMDPRAVAQYRLIGYENRDVADHDFANDDVDGGEIGSGHSVTALYDVVLRSVAASPVTVRLRYREPEGSSPSREVQHALSRKAIRASLRDADDDFRFALAVAGLGEVLRDSPHARSWDLDAVASLARGAAGGDERQELVALVERARDLRRAVAMVPP